MSLEIKTRINKINVRPFLIYGVEMKSETRRDNENYRKGSTYGDQKRKPQRKNKEHKYKRNLGMSKRGKICSGRRRHCRDHVLHVNGSK